jgi:uncharacterized protein (TIGR03083 family)
LDIADLTEVAELIDGAHSELERLVGDIRVLGDDETKAPSELPGWTRGHVLTHLARNADAQVRLLNGALRNERVEQYHGGLSGRAEEIERGADRPAEALIEDVEQSAARLTATWQQMTAEAWDRSAAGTIAGERPASATVWQGGVSSPFTTLTWRLASLHQSGRQHSSDVCSDGRFRA